MNGDTIRHPDITNLESSMLSNTDIHSRIRIFECPRLCSSETISIYRKAFENHPGNFRHFGAMAPNVTKIACSLRSEQINRKYRVESEMFNTISNLMISLILEIQSH